MKSGSHAPGFSPTTDRSSVCVVQAATCYAQTVSCCHPWDHAVPLPTTVRRDFKYAQSDRVLGPPLRFCCCLKFLSATLSQTHYAIPSGFGTCAKLRSLVSALCCALHLLMFCLLLRLYYYNPESSRNPLPFPAWDAKKHWSKIPTGFLDDYCPGTLDALATDLSMEPIAVWNWLSKAFGERCHFAEVNVAVLFAPSIPPLCPSPSAQTQIPHFPSPHRISTWYSAASLVPPQAGIMCGLPWAPSVFRTHKLEAQEMQLLFRIEERLLATNCVTLLEMTDVRAGHSLPFNFWEWHESHFILGEKCGLGMACFFKLLACAHDFCLLSSPPCWPPFRRSRNRRCDRPSGHPSPLLTSHHLVVFCVYHARGLIEGAGDSADNIQILSVNSDLHRPPPPLSLPQRGTREGELNNGVFERRLKRMLQLCGCHSGNPCPLWTRGWFARICLLFSFSSFRPSQTPWSISTRALRFPARPWDQEGRVWGN